MSQVNITLNTNTIDVNTTNNQIVVTDPTNPTAVNVIQPVTQLVEVITSGPQGPPGDPSILTGSFVNINIFNDFTSSYNTGSFTGSFTGSLEGTSSYAIDALTASFAPYYTLTSSFQDFTSSYYQDSSSFDTRIDSLEQFSSSLDATFATDAELNQATASLSASISILSSSFESFTDTYNTGSFTGTFSGSFSGSGADLFDIPASGIVGLNLSQISSGSVSASISPENGLQINTNVTATSFTGSLQGIASTASFAPNYTLTSSFNQFTQSYYQDSSSFDNRIDGLPISQLLREEFTWTSGSSQTFQLLSTASQVYSVEVQGQGALSISQYNVLSSSVQILDQLQNNDYITVLYTNATTGFQPYYSQAQVDVLVNNKELLSNKSTTTTLGTSDTLYPTQNAVKVYVDESQICKTLGGLINKAIIVSAATQGGGATTILHTITIQPEELTNSLIEIDFVGVSSLGTTKPILDFRCYITTGTTLSDGFDFISQTLNSPNTMCLSRRRLVFEDSLMIPAGAENVGNLNFTTQIYNNLTPLNFIFYIRTGGSVTADVTRYFRNITIKRIAKL
jgi:hypothetical protein